MNTKTTIAIVIIAVLTIGAIIGAVTFAQRMNNVASEFSSVRRTSAAVWEAQSDLMNSNR